MSGRTHDMPEWHNPAVMTGLHLPIDERRCNSGTKNRPRLSPTHYCRLSSWPGMLQEFARLILPRQYLMMVREMWSISAQSSSSG